MDDKFETSLGYTVGSFLIPRAKYVTQGERACLAHTNHRLHPQYVEMRVGETPKGSSDSSSQLYRCAPETPKLLMQQLHRGPCEERTVPKPELDIPMDEILKDW